ncbi:MAG: Fe-S cluster assembly scaffold protein NifU [Clostridiales bacterium]|nr:Fe-S cluster assembly scaffold protein NifU [Clostridiales bacterium]
MYNKKVMEHFSNPRNVGEIENASGTGQVGSAACGDIMKIDIKVEDNIIVDVKFKTFGCGAAVASSSIATEMIIGKSVEEALKFTNKDLLKEIGGLPNEKIHCSILAEEALQEAINNYKSKIK